MVYVRHGKYEQRCVSATLVGDLLGCTRQAVYQHAEADWPAWLQQHLRMLFDRTLLSRTATKRPSVAAIVAKGQEGLRVFIRQAERVLDDGRKLPSLEKLAWLFSVSLVDGDTAATIVRRSVAAFFTRVNQRLKQGSPDACSHDLRKHLDGVAERPLKAKASLEALRETRETRETRAATAAEKAFQAKRVALQVPGCMSEDEFKALSK